MNISKSLYLFLIILFIVILIIVIFKSVVPLIGAGIEIKGYIGNLKGNFDIEISNNNDKSSSLQKYQISEHEEDSNHYIESSQPSYIVASDQEENNNSNNYVSSQQNIYQPSYMQSEHEEHQLLQDEEDNSNIDEYLNVIEEENDNLIFNSYIPLKKLNNTELSNMNLDEESIIESFYSIDGYDNPVFVMFYAPWCTFSKNALGDFQKLSQTYQGKINIALVNCEDEKDVAIKHKVQQYPTIRYYPNGMNVSQYVDYTQGRNYNSYIQYLKSITDTII